MGEEKEQEGKLCLDSTWQPRGIEQRAIDWMNDLIKYFPLQCILVFFPPLITKKLDLIFVCVTY